MTRRTLEEYAAMKKRPVAVLLDNVRSMHNVGAMLRTADALGLECVVLAGITGCPPHPEISKTALGAEESVEWIHVDDALESVMRFKDQGYEICVLEQAHDSMPLQDFIADTGRRYLLVVGNEVSGVDQKIVDIADIVLEIPQEGIKHSLNVSVSAGMAIWQMVRGFLMSVIIFALSFGAYAADPYSDYIEKFSEMAVEQQQIYGIPASVTLAQGLLESAAGRSTLAREGNNHFGIKCHKEWKGKTMLRNDDAPDECFRVYDDAAQSYTDHSIFLSRKRYASLFELDPADYAGWARGLKKCGYATDPNYADRLITIIERYALYVYDSASGQKAEETARYIIDHLLGTHPVRRSRGLHYVVAVPGDTYAGIAREFGIKEKKLLGFNDAAKGDAIRAWEEVYLVDKLDRAPEGVTSVTIGEDETIHSVAQRYGMRQEVIKRLNPDAKDCPGTVLKLAVR